MKNELTAEQIVEIEAKEAAELVALTEMASHDPVL